MQMSYFDGLKPRLEAIPGVESVALASALPRQTPARLPYALDGDSTVDNLQPPTVFTMTVGPGYFRTLGASVLSGREFNDSEGGSAIPLVIVNERFAKEHWSGENPLGKRLRLFKGTSPEDWRTVIGVVSNIAQNSVIHQQAADPLIYLPYRERPSAAIWIFARTRIPSGTLAQEFRREVFDLASSAPIVNVFTMTEWFKVRYVETTNITVMFLLFAGIALLLACIGLYAVIAHSVSRQTQDIGIRMAMGAKPGDIVKLVFREGMLPIVIGLTIGLAASLAVNRLLTSALIQVSPGDPLTLVAVSLVLMFSAALGCWIPAGRAMRVDPVVALRHE
jgi:putative ABC transport system permease protein